MQAMLDFPNEHGGLREGTGRKRKREAERDGVPHRSRADVRKHYPMLITVRCSAAIPSLRSCRDIADVVMQAIEDSAHREDFRILEFSVQSNHLHLIVEAEDASALERGVTGLKTRMARRLNRILVRKGPVFEGRFHHRVLRSPRQVRNALDYTLHNRNKHGDLMRGADPLSSADQFGGWDYLPGTSRRRTLPWARTWLLRRGWIEHHGPL